MYRREMIERVNLAKKCLGNVLSYREVVLFPNGSGYFVERSVSGFFDCSGSKVFSDSCKWCSWLSRVCVRRYGQ
jgi:hypothetical protein